MTKNLVIVESPAKAKTIEGFLGKDFTVKSCNGHIRDLAKNTMGIDIENNFEPQYEISSDKKTIIKELMSLSKGAEWVWLATDEDREGEAISWHLFETLNLEKDKTKRIVFHEITKAAILKAIEKSRNIDQNLVDAQQARRILDRLVGYELSPVLWKKVKPALSAGRVQSVAVRLIVDREREIEAFQIKSAYKITALFSVIIDNKPFQFKAELPQRFDTNAEALRFLEKCKNAQFSVFGIETKPAKKSPTPPFTTSTLQQEASRKLGFSVSRTMTLAQRLYEEGKITYMRTDSVNLSDEALSNANAEVIRAYGKEYAKTRQYTTKTKGAQEAHEAIRPVYFNQHEIGGDASMQKLYELIWKRAIASQMSDAILEKTTVNIKISTTEEQFVAKGEVIRFDGFLKVYMEGSDEEEEDVKGDMLPAMNKGDMLNMHEINATQRFSQHPARYTEASLVKKLEELGIGRPSTYAPIISTILKREYVVKEDREGVQRNYDSLQLKAGKISQEMKTEITGTEKSKLFPTDIGSLVNSFLVNYFKNILDYNFTAKVEKEFDEVAQGNVKWTEVIRQFYKPFHLQVEETLKKSEKVTGERLLGIDPVSKRNVYARIGRYGAMVQIGNAEDEEKPRFAQLRKGQSIETIILEEAMELFKLPRKVGLYLDKEIVANIGRFGPYLSHNAKFYSIPKDEDPLTIELDRAIEVILEKQEKDSKKLIKEFKEDAEIKVLNGRWGAYIAQGKKNFKIPKDKVPADLTLEDCLQIIEASGKETPKKATTSKGTKTTSKTKLAAEKKTDKPKTAKSTKTKKK